MQMIDVLKRLAELDATNPNVEKTTVTSEQSLATISNVEGSRLNECGPMGMGMDIGRPNTPASFSINASASSGDEVANMLTQIMNLAGVKPASEEPKMMHHQEIELEPAHAADSGTDDISKAIDIVDKMNTPDDEMEDMSDDDFMSSEEDTDDSPVADMADEVRDMADQLAASNGEGTGEKVGGVLGQVAGTMVGGEVGGAVGGAVGGQLGKSAGSQMGSEVDDMLSGDEKEDESYDNSPNPKYEPHKYGNDQVKPKPQGFPHRQGDNPYTATVESIAAKLLRDYQEFIKG